MYDKFEASTPSDTKGIDGQCGLCLGSYVREIEVYSFIPPGSYSYF